ncbi:MAG: metallophosphoesterase [Eubacteriales bacterium]
MALYAMGDTHLSLATPKEMDIFGGKWVGYMDKIRASLATLTKEDTLLLCGDISWGMSLEEAREDFALLASFDCSIILSKGNHDYWWSSLAKMNHFFEENGFHNLSILHNNCHLYHEIALCGTRGWFYEEERESQSEKIFRRELQRLETSLKQGGEREKLCFLHYPPITHNYRCEEIVELLKEYGVKQCYFGHLHGKTHQTAVEREINGVEYRLISSDFLGFQPLKIKD